jgi:AcrR family transcriptional regulator
MHLARDARDIDATAGELFSKIGYNETTIRMITDKAEIDIRCFYYLFETKEDLLSDVVQQLADSEAAVFEGIVSGLSDPLVKLAAMLNEMFSFREEGTLNISEGCLEPVAE